jgi:hypothetical protein
MPYFFSNHQSLEYGSSGFSVWGWVWGGGDSYMYFAKMQFVLILEGKGKSQKCATIVIVY